MNWGTGGFLFWLLCFWCLGFGIFVPRIIRGLLKVRRERRAR